jgi:hypothetical protein
MDLSIGSAPGTPWPCRAGCIPNQQPAQTRCSVRGMPRRWFMHTLWSAGQALDALWPEPQPLFTRLDE